ncbi:MAG TPA: bifunctional phosphoribosylaminoimidazolecarboxamide formyltransferase/IMP cyclohydrolase [Polyangiaceae bacterium]|jgi:phosphoribosylaminoimidazolecarboxamide formyltransferase/IMP cyclohydrolase
MPIRRALLSVSDKTGLLDFASALSGHGVDLVSTGGTHAALTQAGLRVQSIEDYTGSPELMSGRVKTLHPRVYAGILARTGIDGPDLERIGAQPIDLVAVNLYPFEESLVQKLGYSELIENIDVGGPAMLRAAAKNHERVTVVCDPADYHRVLEALSHNGEVGMDLRQRLASKAFAHTAAYDAAISGWLGRLSESDGYPRWLTFSLEKVSGLRYGENPHQSGAFYRERKAPRGSLALAQDLGGGGTELSFVNLIDLDAALELVREFTQPAAAVVKHASPCGVAVAQNLSDAYRNAREADPTSAFGGIVALNREVIAETAQVINETLIHCVVAPSYAPDALEELHKKKSLRILATGSWLAADHPALQAKQVAGGFVVQERDATAAGEVAGGRVVTRRAPTRSELEALDFSWRVCKHVRSNAIVLGTSAGGGHSTVGIGAGQSARVRAVEIACHNAGARARGSVLASDAFFPFPDGIQAAAQAGVVAIAQPGGSKKDPEVIAAADAASLAMIFTGVRHFKH